MTKLNLTLIYASCFHAFMTVFFTKKLTDVHARFGTDVTLECAVSEVMAECKWYKNGVLLDDGGGKRTRNQHLLRFPSISHDDIGEYECRCGSESTKARVEVKGLCLELCVNESNFVE